MHNDWHIFLETRGARLDAAGVMHFAAAPREAACAPLDLSTLGILAVGGADAGDFLQRQVSNDLRELTHEHSHLSSHCNAKGRVVATFQVLRVADDFWLFLPRSQLAELHARLRRYVLQAQVSFADLSDDWVCLGLLGEDAVAPLRAQCGTPPARAHDVFQAPEFRLVRMPGAVPRWLFVGSAPLACQLWTDVSALAPPANADLWALHDIRAGLPTVYPATRELFVPQMLNLHLIDGVSFHKGCYIGQEVVARMQYLGKLKRRMYWAEVDAVPLPQPGTALGSVDAQSAQGPGTVVDARYNAAGRCELLIVADIAAVARGTLRLGEDGPFLQPCPPPYGFPTPDTAEHVADAANDGD